MSQHVLDLYPRSGLILGATGAPELYGAVLDQVARGGYQVRPRGIPTRELRNVILRLRDPRRSMTGTDIRPGYWPAIGIAEGLQLIGCTSMPDLMVKISPGFAKFREDDGRFHGAYGPRLGYHGQMDEVVQLLLKDPDTRQGVVSIWRPGRDVNSVFKDVPCTIDLVFAIRDGLLILDTHMRSNDVWLGLPYDLMQFTMLQTTVANVLGRTAGAYTHYVNSLHIYERDLEKAGAAGMNGKPYVPAKPVITGIPGTDWEEVSADARGILTGADWATPVPPFVMHCQDILDRALERRIT